jgi:hypothetical protein
MRNAPPNSPEEQKPMFWGNSPKTSRKRIEADLDSQQRRVFGTQELLQLLNPHRKEWGSKSGELSSSNLNKNRNF